jgi:hypothetical protein
MASCPAGCRGTTAASTGRLVTSPHSLPQPQHQPNVVARTDMVDTPAKSLAQHRGARVTSVAQPAQRALTTIQPPGDRRKAVSLAPTQLVNGKERAREVNCGNRPRSLHQARTLI